LLRKKTLVNIITIKILIIIEKIDIIKKILDDKNSIILINQIKAF